MNKIFDYIVSRGAECTWTGDEPTSADQVTQNFLDEDQNGVPRFQQHAGPTLTLEDLRGAYEAAFLSEEYDRINAERTQRLIDLEVSFGGATYTADAEARSNITAMVSAITSGITVPDPVNWRDAANVTQSLSHADVQNLAALMLVGVQAIYETSWALKAAIDAAPDLATAQAVTWP